MAAETVEQGVQLLERMEDPSLSLKEVMDRLECLTTNPSTQRAIIETATDRGIITKDGSTVRPQPGTFLRFEREVIEKEGDFECRRCGKGLSTGYFINLEAGEVGAFGSSCIRKVTGRE